MDIDIEVDVMAEAEALIAVEGSAAG